MNRFTLVFKYIERIANILALLGLILSITIKIRELLGYNSDDKNKDTTNKDTTNIESNDSEN